MFRTTLETTVSSRLEDTRIGDDPAILSANSSALPALAQRVEPSNTYFMPGLLGSLSAHALAFAVIKRRGGAGKGCGNQIVVITRLFWETGADVPQGPRGPLRLDFAGRGLRRRRRGGSGPDRDGHRVRPDRDGRRRRRRSGFERCSRESDDDRAGSRLRNRRRPNRGRSRTAARAGNGSGRGRGPPRGDPADRRPGDRNPRLGGAGGRRRDQRPRLCFARRRLHGSCFAGQRFSGRQPGADQPQAGGGEDRQPLELPPPVGPRESRRRVRDGGRERHHPVHRPVPPQRLRLDGPHALGPPHGLDPGKTPERGAPGQRRPALDHPAVPQQRRGPDRRPRPAADQPVAAAEGPPQPVREHLRSAPGVRRAAPRPRAAAATLPQGAVQRPRLGGRRQHLLRLVRHDGRHLVLGRRPVRPDGGGPTPPMAEPGGDRDRPDNGRRAGRPDGRALSSLSIGERVVRTRLENGGREPGDGVRRGPLRRRPLAAERCGGMVHGNQPGGQPDRRSAGEDVDHDLP